LREPAYTESVPGATLGRGALITSMVQGDIGGRRGARVLRRSAGERSRRDQAPGCLRESYDQVSVSSGSTPSWGRALACHLLVAPNLVPWLASQCLPCNAQC
jgi:hypothetical protein